MPSARVSSVASATSSFTTAGSSWAAGPSTAAAASWAAGPSTAAAASVDLSRAAGCRIDLARKAVVVGKQISHRNFYTPCNRRWAHGLASLARSGSRTPSATP